MAYKQLEWFLPSLNLYSVVRKIPPVLQTTRELNTQAHCYSLRLTPHSRKSPAGSGVKKSCSTEQQREQTEKDLLGHLTGNGACFVLFTNLANSSYPFSSSCSSHHTHSRLPSDFPTKQDKRFLNKYRSSFLLCLVQYLQTFSTCLTAIADPCLP